MVKTGESTASRLVLQNLTERPRTKKELKRVLKATKPGLKKKYTKRALKALVKSGKIKKDGKEYRLIDAKESIAASSSKSATKSILSSAKQVDPSFVPIGMRLREETKKEVRFNDELDISSPGGGIEDEIARLERELNEGNESDDSESSSDENGVHSTDLINDSNGAAILSLSSFANDRVESLPSTSLPVPGKYSLTKKKKGKPKPPVIKSGLQRAVEEVLGGYTARSSEKIPFYCRFCSKQYENEIAFYEHKSTEFHKTAVALERKATYCKLCRKQFTSPIQMKEHLSSRPHKQRLQNVRSRQQSQGRRR